MVETETSERRQALPPPVSAMMNPAFYPHRPRSVELKQTHISYVFLAGDFVYKVKKPVRFPFLDASCRRRRLELCEDEVRFNQRLSSDVYLGVVPIVRTEHGYAPGRPDQFEVAEEFAVKMRRLDERRMLDALIRAGKATPQMMHTIAERVAQFHAAASSRGAWRYGSAAEIWRRVLGDLADYESFIGYTVSENDLRAIEGSCRHFIESRWNLINQRALKGRVREGHGDLRAEQICLEREIQIFDCVEFSEKLRYCDVASEVGFLAMDLDHLGAPRLTQEFVSAYMEISGDDGLAAMLPFYKCYRASIRAMVESRRSQQSEVPTQQRAAARKVASGYFKLAHRYATLCQPALIVVCGLSGTGKSTLAQALRNRIGYEIVNSDSTRKQIAGVAPQSRSGSAYGQGIYSSDFNQKTYRTMLDEAGAIVDSGRGVIVDATFRETAMRRLAVEFASERKLPFAFVECRCDEKEILRRLEERSLRNQDASEATREVYLRQRTAFEPLTDVASENRLVADTGGNLTDITIEVENMIEKLFSVRPGPANA